MSQTLENEIRSALSVSVVFSDGMHPPAASFCIPARHAAASLRPPSGAAVSRVHAAEFHGAPLLQGTRIAGEWMLFDFSGAFYDALVQRTLETLPAADCTTQDHAINRMLVLSRHGGSGCPRVPAQQRTLLLCMLAHQSAAAYARAAHAAERMLHSIPPRERPALMEACGALGSACARLLSAAVPGVFRAQNE